MRSIYWWTVWGLVIAVGIVGLLDAHRSHYYLLVSLPLLTGAFAAAAHRMKYEYHHAMEHAKWAGLSSLFILGSVGFLYLKAQGFGPFATGTRHKALLGTRFEMSVPEVERAVGHHLGEGGMDKALAEKAQQWMLEALPLPLHKPAERYTLPLVLFQVASQLTFYFEERKLGRVELQFQPVDAEQVSELARKVREELAKEYRPVEETPRPVLYRKEAVEASLASVPVEGNRYILRVTLQYSRLSRKNPNRWWPKPTFF